MTTFDTPAKAKPGILMKPKTVTDKGVDARSTLASLNIELGADFHTLRSSQVEELLGAADRVKYQAPKNANGSRARYFHDLLQRRAKTAK